MKKFTYLLVAGLFSLVMQGVKAQTSPKRSCPTFELMEKHFQEDPSARARYASTQQALEAQLRENPQARTQATITIPVVVHILLSSANQSLVTDAIVQSQIDTLNFFYGGSPYNFDSLRVYDPFRTTYGRSSIRFCLAKRTPTNQPTNGIDRIVNTSTYTAGGTHPGSIVVWDPTKYLNIWVVPFTDNTLGYSYTPGTWGASDYHQGFVNDYRAFGAGPGTSSGGFHYDEYNQGRTAVHEIGHYFNLYHPWGPNNSGNPSCTLSDQCSDTPPTNGPFFGCPTAVPVTNVCSPNPPGIMWQNHMDYADDRCMILFTNEQCARMDAAITSAPDRTGLLTSNGCVPVTTGVSDDASISAIITPAPSATVSCGNLVPVVTLSNLGTNTLTSVKINVTLNGSPAGGSPYTWTGSLASGSSVNVTLSTITLAPVVGSNTLVISTSNPNGNTDNFPSNDASSVSFTKSNGVTLPLIEGFQSTTFPPTGWTRTNNGQGGDWARTTAAGSGSTASAWLNYYSSTHPAGSQHMLTTPTINTGAATSINVKFDVAHRQYPGSFDRLVVEISKDCGGTWSTVYDKNSGTGLVTTTTGSGSYVPASAADWRTETIVLSGAQVTGSLQVRFHGYSDYGNNIFIDNINIDMPRNRDLSVTAVSRPGAAECGTFQPVATVKNNGLETVNSYSVTYSIDGGAPVSQAVSTPINPGATATVTLAAVTPTAGNHNITVCTTNPVSASGSGDDVPANDCFTKAFTKKAILNPPVTEGFEGTTFPPTGWALNNPDNDNTWVWVIPGSNSANSMAIDNYDDPDIQGTVDDLVSPPINATGVDSVIVSWELAHKAYPDQLDGFLVLTSKDCANTFSNTIFSRYDPALSNFQDLEDFYAAPVQADWQTLRASAGGTALSAGYIQFAFRNDNGYGNNTFVDNINITLLYKRDLKMVSINQPGVIACTGNFTPQVTVMNNGSETVTAFKVAYAIDGGAAQTTTVTGVSLARNATTVVNLTPAVTNLATGNHTIKVYSFEPTTASGTGDQYTANDTLSKGFGITGTTTAPLVEAFEGTFPPTGWAVANPDGGLTWTKAPVGKNSSASAYVRNRAYTTLGAVDDLYTPSITYTNVDSAHLSFDVAAATFDYPGTTAIQIDTLEVLATNNCGTTFTSIYKKYGADLQTINDPNYPQTVEFSPLGAAQWRTEDIDLTNTFTPNGPIQLVFRNTANHQNNIYVDNVNMSTKTLPAFLKEKGYLVLPNPFHDQFTVWHLVEPTNLRSIAVYNSAGKMVWKKEYHGNAVKQITVDLTGQAAGTYIVNLRYEDRQRDTQVKVVKL